MTTTPADTAAIAPVDHSSPLVDLATLRVRIDDRSRLLLSREGQGDVPVTVRRAFPWSRPDQFISLRSKDGQELAMLESLDAPLPVEARETILRSLDAATFIPRITRVTQVQAQHGGVQIWDVETDAGTLQIRVQEREDVRFLSETRFSIKDAHGNVYEIPNVEALDDHSRREVARVI
jgi:hypothetical protein